MSRAAMLIAGLLAMGVFGCSGSSRSAAPAARSSSSQETDLGLDELRKSLESTVLENYLQLGYGNIEAFAESVATDIDLQIVGVVPKDVVIGVSPASLRADRRLFAHRIRDGLRILSKNLDVYLSADGSVGWIFDEISYRVMYMGREASIPIRVTGVYVRDVERWVMVAEHRSYGVTVEDIVAMERQGKLVPGRSFKTRYGTSKELAAYLAGIAGRFANTGLAGEPADDTLIVLPAAELEFHGQNAASAPALARVFGPLSKVEVRDFRVELAQSKRVAWMLANILVKTDRNGDAVEIPLRASFVFERRTDKEWELVQTHVSAALQERRLSEHVFGPNE